LMHDPHNWPSFKAGDDLSGDDLTAFFVRLNDGRFSDIGPEVGFTEPMVSRGIAIADVDGDGKIDFALANQWGESYFYRNQSPARNDFVGLHLLLPLRRGPTHARRGHPSADTPGRPAVGAPATITLPGGRRFSSQVDGGRRRSGN